MKIAPLDLRRARFGSAVLGFSRAEAVSFVNMAADGYEQAIRDADRLRQQVNTLQKQLEEHRQREATSRGTLRTAQRVSAEVRESAKQEAQLIVREARSQADELVRKAGARCQDVKREIADLRRKRTDVEASLEGSIAVLRHALEGVNRQDSDRPQEDKTRPHHPRPSHRGTGTVQPAPHPVITSVRSQPLA